MEDPTVERSFRGHKDVITGLSFKPSMTQLASSSMDYSVMVWNFKPQLRAFRFVGHKGVVTDVDFASTGNLLASSSRDKTVRLWTPNVKGDVTVFRAHTSSVRTVQFSADSENILTSSDDKTVKIWSTQKTKFQFTLAGHLNWVRTAKFSPDARLVVSGSDDKTVKLWDLRSKSCIKTYWDHVGMVTSVAFHPSGTIIASASTDKSIKLFDIRTHKLIQHYGDAHTCENDGGAAQGGVNSIGFGGRSGEWLVSTGMDGLVKIWDLKEGHIFYTLHGHKNGPTTAATFSNDGQFFATGGSDSQIMVWKSNLENISKLSYSTAAYDDRATFHSSKSHAYGEPFLSNKSQQKSRSSSPVRIASAGGIVSKPGQSQGLMNESLDKSNPKEVTSLGPSIFAEHLSRNIDIDIAQTRERSLEPLCSSKSSTESSPKHHSPNQQQPQQASPHSMTSPLEIQDNHPEQLTRTIQQLVGHLDMLTQTMSILENRLSTNEDRVIDIAKRFESSLNRLEAKLDSKKASSSSPINRPASPSKIPIMKNRMANRNASPVPSNISNKSASQQQNSIFLDGFDEEQDTQL